MLGAIAGDIIGSVHEWAGTKSRTFELFADGCRFTDDTVLTVAVAESLLDASDLVNALHRYVHRYPQAGYGGTFVEWAFRGDRDPYHSWGNGSAMRVSPVGFTGTTLEQTLAEAKRTAAVTHDHPEGIRGAQATAGAIFLARTGHDKSSIRQFAEEQIGYDLSQTLDEIRPTYSFDVSCQGSVPQSIIAFLEGEGYEETVRNAISLGGDADTMACIAGGIAEAFWGGIPAEIRDAALNVLDDDLRGVVLRFYEETGRQP